MADPTTPGAPAPAPEPPKAADAAQKKQTVRISLPPKPAAGPSIKIPAPAAAPAAAQAAAAPAAAPAATTPPAPAAAPAAAKPAAPAPAVKPAAAPAPVAAARPAAVTVSPLEIGLAFATVVVGICIIVRLLFLVPAAS
ncbi:MAG: hypothetical protein JNL10_20070 [Verrucomicrobiales bacterium]|nr:hypothetical protein [Verrucomicrobiales bacterium]